MAAEVGSEQGAALLAARREREVSTERLVNRARQFGVVLGFVQFGLFTDYLPGTRAAGLVFAVSYGLIAWWSSRVLADDPDLDRLRRLTSSTLALDTGLLASTAVVLAYQDDPTNLLLMVLPLLEGAMKRGLPGALVLSGVAMGTEAVRVLVRASVHDLPVEPAESTFFGGMMLLIALFAGGIVRLQVQAQDQLAAVNDRLATTRRLLRTGLASFAGGVGLQDILAQAVQGFSLEAAVVRPSADLPVAWPPEAATDPVVEVLVRELGQVTSDSPELEHTDGRGRQWLALPLDAGERSAGALLVRLAGAGGRDDARALQAELSALMRATVALAVEEELREARGRLDRLRHDFVAITTHEIRTPLSVVKGALETLRGSGHEEHRAELLDAAERQARRLERVVENLQVVQRLDEGRVGVRHSEVSLESVVASLLAEVGHDEDDVRVGIASSVAAWADAHLLRTVLACLVDNAFTHGDGREVEIVAEHDGENVVVDVSDAGPGVPTQARVRIFERFAAVDARHHRQGAGIGLPLARELARLMEGDVTLLDQQRTTFRLVLPARDPKAWPRPPSVRRRR